MTYEETRRRFNATVNRPALKMALKFHRVSYAELARVAGVSKGTVGNLMSRRTTCTPENAAKIAHALHCQTQDLFTLTSFNADSTQHVAA